MISVVTPSLPQRGTMLAEAVASVNAQTIRPSAHLICVDHRYAGPAPTLNKLIRAADTEWVSILADDDLYDPDHLETLQANAGSADIVFSWCRYLGDDRPQYRGDFDVEMLRAKRDTGMRGCFMFRRSLYTDIGGWPLSLGEDWQFLVNAADAGATFAPVYRETWTYRQHDGSTSAVIRKLQNGEFPEQMFHVGKHLLANL